MRYGVTFPYLPPQTIADLSVEVEAAGWDGVFVWDAIWGLNCWVTLAAVAIKTKRVMLGPMLVPLSRRRPWEVASEMMTLDHLSNGRAILSAGLGATDTGWDKVGEMTDKKVRAARLDEALEIISRLWTGENITFEGQHFQVRGVQLDPLPIQKPRPPLWVVGAFPRQKSMQRVVKYDGMLVSQLTDDHQLVTNPTAETIRAIREYATLNRVGGGPFDLIMEGETDGANPEAGAAKIQPWAEAGLTWWLENVWAGPYERGGIEGIRERIRQGPPAMK